jgi:hypothetical protein
MKKTIILVATALSGLAMIGCSKEVTSSANIRTAGISALIDVTAEDDQNSTVHVDLRVGGSSSNTFVILESGDKLVAEAKAAGATAPTTIDMQAQSEGEYEAEFATAAADTEFVVKLERSVDDDALLNSGRLPSPFQITGVPTASPSRKNEDVTITWTPTDADARMFMELSGTCIFNKSIEIAGDEGTYTIGKETLDSTGGDMPSDCVVTVEIRRTQTGTADPIFDKESWFKLHQVRKATFASKP